MRRAKPQMKHRYRKWDTPASAPVEDVEILDVDGDLVLGDKSVLADPFHPSSSLILDLALVLFFSSPFYHMHLSFMYIHKYHLLPHLLAVVDSIYIVVRVVYICWNINVQLP